MVIVGKRRVELPVSHVAQCLKEFTLRLIRRQSVYSLQVFPCAGELQCIRIGHDHRHRSFAQELIYQQVLISVTQGVLHIVFLVSQLEAVERTEFYVYIAVLKHLVIEVFLCKIGIE